MSGNLAITIDIGTTNSKVSLFEITTGKLIDRETFQTDKKEDAFGELFDLESIWNQLSTILKKFINTNSGNVDSINISSVGEAGVLVDNNGDIVTPLIAWYDKRASSYIDCLTEVEKEQIYEVTGLPAHTNYSLPKIKWLVDNFKFSNSGPLTWLNIPDLLCYFLTGEMKTEYSMASRTLGYDLQKRQWSKDILALFDLEEIIQFPEVVRSGEIVGYTDRGELKELNNEHISVRIAGHDHMVGALGIGLAPNELLNSTGTTEGLLLISDANFNDSEELETSLSNGIFTKPNYYTLFSSMPTGGSAFAWYQELFNKNKSVFLKECSGLYQRYMNNQIKLKDALLFLPHLNGSGAPFKNSQSKGLLYGLNLETTSKDILLGIILGLSLELKHVANCFPLQDVKRLVVIGPAINNPLWLQMKADALNTELKVVKLEEAVSFGALKSAYPEFSTETVYETFSPKSTRVSEMESLLEEYINLYIAKKQLIQKDKTTS
jgi:sugar (pentulose or hexulose) kinase